MNVKTALNHQKRAVERLRDLYSSAEIFGLTSAEINTRYNDILTHCHGCPSWVREYVNGYRRCLDDNLYRHSLVHGGFVSGRFFSTHSNRPDYYDKHNISPLEYADDGRVTARGHYWIRHVDAGKPKPFFTMEQTQ